MICDSSQLLVCVPQTLANTTTPKLAPRVGDAAVKFRKFQRIIGILREGPSILRPCPMTTHATSPKHRRVVRSSSDITRVHPVQALLWEKRGLGKCQCLLITILLQPVHLSSTNDRAQRWYRKLCMGLRDQRAEVTGRFFTCFMHGWLATPRHRRAHPY